jgi:hypothetical protein
MSNKNNLLNIIWIQIYSLHSFFQAKQKTFRNHYCLQGFVKNQQIMVHKKSSGVIGGFFHCDNLQGSRFRRKSLSLYSKKIARNMFRLGVILPFVFGVIVQGWGQRISGHITDAYSGAVIPNASISIQKDQFESFIIADLKGYYQIDSLTPGRYQIKIQQEGYQTLIAQEVLVTTGKALHFNHQLTPISFEMDPVIVRASDSWDIRTNAQVEVIGIEQTERFPANFQDPARVVNAYAGVAQLNDQANHLSIRGLSPAYSKWYLEGMEIVNPNHTSNAGTITDLPTQAGGGVLLFSSQVLGNTILSKGPHAVQYSNALSGIVDLNYRNPSPDETQYSISLSLIGLEAVAEGAFGKKKKNSWLANYRYSTIGFLSDLGVPLGDEDIRFQDAHLQMNFQTGEKSALRLFGFWGYNQNIFKGKENASEREENKERFDINFDNTLYGVGLKYRSLIGSNAVLRIGAVFSNSDAGRQELEIKENQNRSLSQSLLQDNRLFSSFIERQSKAGASGRFTLGLQYKWIDDSGEQNILASGIIQSAMSGSRRSQTRPYAEYLIDISTAIKLDLGLAGSYWSNSESFMIEPQIAFYYRIGSNTDLSLRYQIRSQDFAQPISEINQIPVINNLPVTGRGHLLSLGIEKQINQSSQFSSSVFYTSIQNAPIYSRTQFTSQTFDAFPQPGITYEGKERVYGLEVSYDRMISNALFLSANTTIYKSQIEAPKSGWLDARFDGGYIVNLSVGKEFEKVAESHQRTFGMSGRITILGGLRDRVIDEVISQQTGATFYPSDIYTQKLPTYFRPDLSIYLIKNKGKRTIRWSLDIQNAGNIQNTAYSYYDVVLQKVVVKKQLGIIPILSWRIGF